MGSVYLIEQPLIERLAALKVLPRELAANESISVRFENEARVMAQLQHPNIVALYEHGRSEKAMLYLLMEFVDGGDLRQLIDQGPITKEEAIRLTDEVCTALQFAHDAGVTHRDIKPSNILLTRERQVKLADFGLARLLRNEQVDLQLTLTGDLLGTFDYLAPEQREGRDVDGRTDIYGVGVTLYETLTGKLPRVAYQRPSKAGRGTRRLDRVVAKALAAEPKDRYQSPKQLSAALAVCRRSPVHSPIWRASAAALAILTIIVLITRPWKPPQRRGLIFEDTFSEHTDNWSIHQARGKELQQRDGKMIWDTNGADVGRASIAALSDLFLDPQGHYRIEFEMGEFELLSGPNADYSVYFGLVGADYDRTNLAPWNQTVPLLSLHLAADAQMGMNLVASYKDGSGVGPNGTASNGQFTNGRFLTGWDGRRFHVVWFEILDGIVRTGWSGGDQVVDWLDLDPVLKFSPPDLDDFTGPMRLFMYGHNGGLVRGAHGRGGHACRRITVQRLE